jgi:hypothetical protein
MRNWEFVYDAWFTTVYDFKSTPETQTHLSYTPSTNRLVIEGDTDINVGAVKRLVSRLSALQRFIEQQ